MAAEKFKPGEIVQVRDYDWYSENQVLGTVCFTTVSTSFISEMSAWCGKTLTIKSIETTAFGEYYLVGENHFAWVDEMFEDSIANKKNTDEDDIIIDGILKLIDIGDGMKKIIVNKDYELMINPEGDSFVIPKLKFPKTVEECYEILNKETGLEYSSGKCEGYRGDELTEFQKLLVCRDVYWKLLGDWQPSKHEIVYKISRLDGRIIMDDDRFGEEVILEFPTREIRDMFWDNFKSLIEYCKKLI